MKQWQTLFKKEMIGNFRDRKWIWVPLVFILLMIMDPITTYYLPEILEIAGGLPEGAVFEMPPVNGTDAILMSFSQLNTFGVLIIVLISMNTIAGERKSGIAELILVKPVSYISYILSKWAALFVLVAVSYVISVGFASYYVGILFESIPLQDILLLTVFYGIWLTFVITLSIFYNTLVKSGGLVAFLTLTTVIGMSAITPLFGENLRYSPSNILSHLTEMLETAEIPGALYGSAISTIILCLILLSASIYFFRTKEHAG